MELNYAPEKQLSFLTSHTYNGGSWVQAEVARALRNNVETGVLRVTLNGVREDLMDTIALPAGLVFQMRDCLMFFGGLPPTHEREILHRRVWHSFLGQMRAITISNPGSNSLINPLYTQRYKANPYYGVSPDCDKQRLKAASFSGESYLEVKVQPLRTKGTIGFSFQTFTSNGLLMFANLRQDQGLSSYYSISVVDGCLSLKFVCNGRSQATFTSEKAFNDGLHHTISVVKDGQR